MKQLSVLDYNEIRTWVHRHARPLELARWRYHFENGSREAFLSELGYYRNEDGGFGNAMEPDSWNPESTPYTTLKALELLDETGIRDASHPVIQGIMTYLAQCPHATINGWPFSIPSSDHYPHAPWWTFNPEANQYESIGVTTGLCAFILRYADKSSLLHEKGLALANRMLSDFLTVDNFGEMGLGGFSQLMAAIEDTGLAEHIRNEESQPLLAYCKTALRTRIQAAIERDTALWIYHKVKPSQYVRTPDSPFLKGLEDITETELDYLVQTRPAGDVWPIDWSWFDNNDIYPREFAISETWWKAWTAIDKLLFLRSFGRVQA